MNPSQPSSIPRYLPTYRQAELDLICRFAQRGASLGLVGLAGAGKSNIVAILREQRAFRARYLGPAVDRVRFAVVDARSWGRTPQQLWQLMLDGLQAATGDLPPPPDAVLSLDREVNAVRKLQGHIDWVCQAQQQQLMFVLDDFDGALATGPVEMIEQLNTLRSAGNRDRLAYLVMTKRLPHVLIRSHHLTDGCKFLDLFSRDIYALQPYVSSDAEQMVRYLNSKTSPPLSVTDLRWVLHLGGNHSSLIRAVFDTWLRRAPDQQDPQAHFAAQPDVRKECQRILDGLHPQEQAAATRLAQGRAGPEDALTIDHLARRGVLASVDPLRWFSPLMGDYLRGLPLP